MRAEEVPEGFYRWLYFHPPDALLILWRPSWDGIVIAYPWDVPPEADIGGLYWALTGIAKVQLGNGYKPRMAMRGMWTQDDFKTQLVPGLF